MYNNDDFDSSYFPPDGHRVYDSLGDICKLNFPVGTIKWVPVVYNKAGTSFVPKPRLFLEKISVTLVKS